jgi:diphthamide synthase (EF-2-diphthine--ammonia ligase)/ABC-type Fe3+-hydroxamate transport system substrate-binding protein
MASTNTEASGETTTTKNLRIACLIPSATDICVALGLGDAIVGITHECRRDGSLSSTVRILTSDGVNAATSTQAEIHAAVQQQSEDAQKKCAAIPSLYPILPEEFAAANPNLVLTQDLCNVCAPSSVSVKSVLKRMHGGNDSDDNHVEIISLTPDTLQDVVDTFAAIANACGVPDRGRSMVQEFWKNLKLLERAIMCENTTTAATSNPTQPRMLLLEWLDPPFDAGHWMPDMMECAKVCNAFGKTERKSKQRTWDEVSVADPDLVLISCCGFDLDRNYRDAVAAGDALRKAFPRACAAQKVFACDGDTYFANPGPNLLIGAVIMALAAYEDSHNVTAAVTALPFLPPKLVPFRKVDFRHAPAALATAGMDGAIPDIEDFDALHRAACEAGQMSYKDPSSGYSVFTELAHKARGKCCGSGCRHCPYSHENVKDKAAKIQQPAFLYKAANEKDDLFDLSRGNTRVLFVSGGKDSFLAIRAMVREAAKRKFGLALLTTFDATSRIIAHQDISIDAVVHQAKHLDISLVGVPMHRGSSEGYVTRVQRGLDVIENHVGSKVKTLVFGDLHLEHIKGWRDDQLGPLGYELLYPLFNVPFSTLEIDLEASQVPCQVTSSTVNGVAVGEMYSCDFRQRIADQSPGVDLFGENGEFHTLAQVWKVDRSIALGLETP